MENIKYTFRIMSCTVRCIRELEIPNMPTTCVGWDSNKETTRMLRQAALQPPADMDFSGTWKLYSDDNLEEFLKAMDVPEMVVKMSRDIKPVTVIKQNGDNFTIKVTTPLHTIDNSFTLGKETEVTAFDGRKLKCTMRAENGKLITEAQKFTSVRVIQGEEMVETLTAGSVTLVRRNKRI